MPKDRLEELRQKVEGFQQYEDINISNHFSVVDMEGSLLAEFFNKINSLIHTVDRLSVLVDQVEEMQSRLLALPHDDKIQNQLESKMVDIRRLSNDVRKYMRVLKDTYEADIRNSRKNLRQRIIEAHLNILTRRFCDTMNRYYQLLIKHREACKTVTNRQLQIVGVEMSSEEVEQLLQNQTSIFYLEMQKNIIEQNQILSDVKGRCSDLKSLETSLLELHEIFLEVAFLIESQGVRINSIADYISRADGHIRRTEAIVIQSRRLNRPVKKKTYVIIVLIYVLLI